MIAVGIVACIAPAAAGRWSLDLLSLPLFALSVVEARDVFSDPHRRLSPSCYLPAAIALLAGSLLAVSPALALNALVILVAALLAIDGGIKLSGALLGRTPADRGWLPIDGVVNLALAASLWMLREVVGATAALGLAVGGATVMAGWRILLAPEPERVERDGEQGADTHPDPRIGLAGSASFAQLRVTLEARARIVVINDLMWLATIIGIFLAIHAGRMQSGGTWLGLISPVVATAGDVVMSLLIGIALLLPLRLGWRRLTRPLERAAWARRLADQPRSRHEQAFGERLVSCWLDARFGFALRLRAARTTLPQALLVGLRLGIPVTAFFVAINPIWGFNWYFNTESWASGFYQKVTELRVDRWRERMIEAIESSYGGSSASLFRVAPAGIDGAEDFAFLVIGDPGEGDASQWSLAARYLELGRRDDIKFLVVSSDVIYPAGAMSDYESKFYLPFKGFTKPIFAIPGNHDWFDALEGFNANFLEPKAARAAMHARLEADLGPLAVADDRTERLVAEAARLRGLYGIANGAQRAPFFELQTDGFALLAIDTGIQRTIDAHQHAWLEAALDRSRGKFTMALLGHPRFAGGMDTARGDAAFAALHRLLAERGVAVVMAGDTHDLEYYREPFVDPGGSRTIHHFVNGGGGAYLSIGTALDWKLPPATADWAIYPRPDMVRAKLNAETARWK